MGAVCHCAWPSSEDRLRALRVYTALAGYVLQVNYSRLLLMCSGLP